MPRINDIVIATGNRHKLTEIRECFKAAKCRINLRSIKEWQHEFKVEENGSSYIENARRKAEAAVKIAKLPVLADDSGLEVEALQGQLGVHSAVYAGSHATDTENNEKLLAALNKVGREKRQARYVCTLIVMQPDGESYETTGEAKGLILHEPQGIAGFGYDPLFWSDEANASFAELSLAEKNRFSHRGRAILAMIKKLRDIGLLQ